MFLEQRRRRFCEHLNEVPNEENHVRYDSQMCGLNSVAVLHCVARDEQNPTLGRVWKLRFCTSERIIVFSKPLQVPLYQFPGIIRRQASFFVRKLRFRLRRRKRRQKRRLLFAGLRLSTFVSFVGRVGLDLILRHRLSLRFALRPFLILSVLNDILQII